jgi:hypothetical protein
MMSLQSPALSAPLAEWLAWQNKLQKMKGSDPTVAFARKRASLVIQQLELREQSQPTPAATTDKA